MLSSGTGLTKSADRNFDVSPEVRFQKAKDFGEPSPAMDFRAIGQKVVQHLSTEFEADELCHQHTGEQIIAHEVADDGRILHACNRCIYEHKLKKPVFIAYEAKQIKQRIDKAYDRLHQNELEINNLETKYIEERVRRQVTEFFAAQARQLKEMEKAVLSQISGSQNLTQLQTVHDAMHGKLQDENYVRLQDEGRIINLRVELQRYAFVARRKQHYESLEQEMEEFNEYLESQVKAARKHANDLFSIEEQWRQISSDGLFKIAEDCIKIDTQNLNIRNITANKNVTSAFEINLVASETNPAKKPIVVNMDQDLNMEVSDFLIPEKSIEVKTIVEKNIAATEIINIEASQRESQHENTHQSKQSSSKPSAMKQNIVADNSDQAMESYFTNANKNIIFKNSIKTGKHSVLVKIPFFKKPKTVFTRDGQVFIIGGLDWQDKVTGKCYKVVDHALKEIHPMTQSRISYGCCVTNELIYIAGGLTGTNHASATCEVYEIKTNQWMNLDSLPVATFSLSLSLFDSNSLIAVGGTDDQKRHLTTIYTLDLTHHHSKWQRIVVNLLHPLTNPGLYQPSLGKMIIFGGWNVDYQSGVYILKEFQSGYKITRAKAGMDKPDVFPVNGVWRADSNGEMLIPGLTHVHRLCEKNSTVKWEHENYNE